MPRSASPFAIFATLTVGIALGVILDRGGPFVAAQVTDGEHSQPPTTAIASSRQPSAKPSGEEELYRRLNRQYEKFEQVNRTFELVSEAVSPAVVHIVAHKTSKGENTPRTRRYEESGSGVIVRGEHGRQLYVLTNDHVITGAAPEKVDIFLKDGRSVHPTRIWLDAKTDIALLGLGREDLPAARLGDSDTIAVGTWVLALGSPFGLTHSVSQGIISARGRHMEELEGVEYQDFLQTDAAINPGNSGGPLVNMRGEVIGINNSIASNGGGNEGVGFSIPVNLARWIMNQFLTKGRITRGALGVDLHPEFRPEDALSLGLDRPRGAWVSVVRQRMPAEAAGVRRNDVILRFGGVDVQNLNHLINMVSMAPIGQSVEVVVFRDRKSIALNVMVGERDGPVSQKPATPTERSNTGGLLRRPDRPGATSSYALGLELNTLDVATARRLGLPADERGVVVDKVAPDSPFASLFKPNDVIASVDGRPMRTADEAVLALNRSAGRGPLLLEVDRLVKGSIERRSIKVP